MKLDFATLAFGYRITAKGGTPNWATSLGQSKSRNYRINDDIEIDEILKGMVYCAAPPMNVYTIVGKGNGVPVYGHEVGSPIVSGALFKKVYINDILIEDGKFILLITKDDSPSHPGRLRLKYGPKNAYKEGQLKYTNEEFYAKVNRQLGLATDACWFVSEINVRNQDELILTAHIVNAGGMEEYPTGVEHHAAWERIVGEPWQLKNSETDSPAKVGENILLYGVPGCGKSHTIKKQYCDDETLMERVVFHPDYSYSDFIGQILPQSRTDENGKKHISYPFIPGPFTRILKKAVDNKDSTFYLIIEEINRGNAPAIFGEVFQLLDRTNGVSDYGISNAEIAEHAFGNSNTLVKIPANLFILATMNTADQNVFTLDTAFKRRWKMKSIENSFINCTFATNSICKTNTTWEAFVSKINAKIIEYGKDSISTEDSRLGAFFVKEDELEDASTFAEKVLMYLWNDAFKYNRDKIFKSEYETLESLISGFKGITFGVFLDELGFDNTVLVNDTTDTDSAISAYLSGKNDKTVELFESLISSLKNKIPSLIKYMTKTNDHVCIKAFNKVLAEIFVQRERVKIHTKVPNSSDLQIGEMVPDTHGWSLNYTIILDEMNKVNLVANAIMNSHNLGN